MSFKSNIEYVSRHDLRATMSVQLVRARGIGEIGGVRYGWIEVS